VRNDYLCPLGKRGAPDAIQSGFGRFYFYDDEISSLRSGPDSLYTTDSDGRKSCGIRGSGFVPAPRWAQALGPIPAIRFGQNRRGAAEQASRRAEAQHFHQLTAIQIRICHMNAIVDFIIIFSDDHIHACF
jgi:hypothetical protein